MREHLIVMHNCIYPEDSLPPASKDELRKMGRKIKEDEKAAILTVYLKRWYKKQERLEKSRRFPPINVTVWEVDDSEEDEAVSDKEPEDWDVECYASPMEQYRPPSPSNQDRLEWEATVDRALDRMEAVNFPGGEGLSAFLCGTDSPAEQQGELDPKPCSSQEAGTDSDDTEYYTADEDSEGWELMC